MITKVSYIILSILLLIATTGYFWNW